MASSNDRLSRFQALLAGKADLAFVPISTDLDYLAGIARDIPNYGATLHPGGWLEGAWLTPDAGPVLALPRMTAEYGGKGGMKGVDLRVLGDWDDPERMVRDILAGFRLPAKPRVAVSDFAHAESLVHLQRILPDAVFVSGTAILREMRVVKSDEEIAAVLSYVRSAWGNTGEAIDAALVAKIRDETKGRNRPFTSKELGLAP